MTFDAPTFDRDATKEALDMWGRFGPPRPGTGTPLSDLNQIVQAARWAVEVTEGDGIWWCERHQCRWGYAPNCAWEPGGEACPKSRRLLIEWEADGVAAPSFLAARGSVPNNNGRSATDIVRELRESE